MYSIILLAWIKDQENHLMQLDLLKRNKDTDMMASNKSIEDQNLILETEINDIKIQLKEYKKLKKDTRINLLIYVMQVKLINMES